MLLIAMKQPLKWKNENLQNKWSVTLIKDLFLKGIHLCYTTGRLQSL